MGDHSRQELLLQIIFLLLGVGVLIPWNAFLSAKAYWVKRFCQSDGDPEATYIEALFVEIFNVTSVFSLGSIILFQYFHDQRHAQQVSEGTAADDKQAGHNNSSHGLFYVTIPLLSYLLVFVSQAIAVLIPSIPSPVFRYFTLLSLGFCGVSRAIAMSGIVATAGLFPSQIAMVPFQSGLSAGGLAVAVAYFIAAYYGDPKPFLDLHCASTSLGEDAGTKASLTGFETCLTYTEIDIGVFFYFVAGGIVLVGCIAGFAYVDRFQQDHHRDGFEMVMDAAIDDQVHQKTESNPDSSITGPKIVDESGAPRSAEKEEENTPGIVGSGLNTDDTEPSGYVGKTEETNLVDKDESSDVPRKSMRPAEIGDFDASQNEMGQVWNLVKEPAITIAFIFIVTLSLFPQWIAELRSVNQCRTTNRLANDLYTPFAIVLFNFWDLIGRLLAGNVRYDVIANLRSKLIGASLVRFIFFPLLFLCAGGEGRMDHFVIPSDIYSVVVQSLFAISNGFFSTAPFIYAPAMLPSVAEIQERASEILNFALYFGLLTGSLLASPASSFVNHLKYE